ncbi:hypothetical protein ACFLZX_04885 [Nanoarchaeota archaeon]
MKKKVLVLLMIAAVFIVGCDEEVVTPPPDVEKGDCIADLGEMPIEGCHENCELCKCTTNQGSDYTPLPTDDNVICVKTEDGRGVNNVWVAKEFVPDCPDKGLTGFCLCGRINMCDQFKDCIDEKCVLNEEKWNEFLNR